MSICLLSTTITSHTRGFLPLASTERAHQTQGLSFLVLNVEIPPSALEIISLRYLIGVVEDRCHFEPKFHMSKRFTHQSIFYPRALGHHSYRNKCAMSAVGHQTVEST